MSPEAQALEPLCQALALVEGFQLLILECSDVNHEGLQRILDAALTRVAQLRGARPLLFHYDPYQTTEEEGALRDEAWVEGVLQPILELPRPAGEAGSVIAVIDGTRAAYSDGSELPSWLFLFHRVNERRNTIAHVFAGTLVFALPPLLVRMFLEEAPDAASIRSGLFRLHAWLVPAARGPAPPATSRPARTRGENKAHRPPEAALINLLLSLSSADQLRRHVAMMPGGELLIAELPGIGVSSSELAFSVVELLGRHGMIGDFLDHLMDWFPHRRDDIQATIAQLTAQDPRPLYRGAVTDSSSQSRPITVLMVSANADPAWRLQMDREFRTLISRARHGRLYMIYAPVWRSSELREAIVRQTPTVVHLHADIAAESDLVFPPGLDASPDVFALRALLGLLDRYSDEIRLVVVEASNARGLAREISSVIDYVIAVDAAATSDYLRIDFFAALYEALAFDRTIEQAFAVAVGGIETELDDAFELYTGKWRRR